MQQLGNDRLLNNMFNFGALAANVLNSLDNAAKDTLEEPRISATALRSQRQGRNNTDGQQDYQSEEEDNAQDDIASPEVQAPLVRFAFYDMVASSLTIDFALFVHFPPGEATQPKQQFTVL